MTSYTLAAARQHLGDLVAEARDGHRPVTITQHGKPVAAVISVADLADLEESAAAAAYLADKHAARQNGVPLAELEARLDAMDAEGA